MGFFYIISCLIYAFRGKISCGVLYAGRMEDHKRITGAACEEIKGANKKGW